jgi:hypothetical protein
MTNKIEQLARSNPTETKKIFRITTGLGLVIDGGQATPSKLTNFYLCL